ncbi:ribulose-phosphate 3-epimerase [Candidatus Woesearchaeota archaeon]|nr:ribulose-phosphate 3-epimerase [Candidatus Woesearchaeota archaeon]
MKKYELSASLICADLMNLENEVKNINESKIEYIHFDVMDGHFVPRLGVFPEMLSGIRKLTKKPIDVHLMISNPEEYIPIFSNAGADIIYVHVENNLHLHRTLKIIKENNVKAGVVLNIATPLSSLDYILEEIEYIMLMAINPGIVGHKIILKIYDKIRAVKEKIKGTNIKIMIDGGVNPETAHLMIKSGADILVGGTSSLFRPKEGTLIQTTKKFREKIDKNLDN